ncbi:triacylglycerol lipase [Oculatella sp. LEGE 06141]|uniref:esterase/lipase family protein n=1 Tax=Oculatella sp. LEGE 06141 TaxID=1828648 RepID=UPI00187EEF1A|nr:triacylglycerol lipase [Oculatella sp. LEGE 06141]MBE9177403.1 triacylglycerol lipase [Oculatella sp. LEGE 06141]
MSAASRNPVLLIHGIDDTNAIFCNMSLHLKALGWPVYHLDLFPNDGAIGIDEMAGQIAEYVDRTFAAEQPIDLVGFSMGGLVSRYYVQRLGGIDRVQRFITISSPHQGTWLAYFRFNVGCNQMRCGSAFLNDLNRDVSMLEQINFTSIWTPMDLMIFPAHSSRMPVGQEIIVQVPLHSWMVSNANCWKAVVTALSEPLRPSRPPEQTLLPQKLQPS